MASALFAHAQETGLTTRTIIPANAGATWVATTNTTNTSGNVIGNIVNNNLGSFFESNTDPATASPQIQLAVDMATTYTANGLFFKFRQGTINTTRNSNLKEVKIETFANGNWTVQNFAGNPTYTFSGNYNGTNGTDYKYVPFSAPVAFSQYRITVISNFGYTNITVPEVLPYFNDNTALIRSTWTATPSNAGATGASSLLDGSVFNGQDISNYNYFSTPANNDNVVIDMGAVNNNVKYLSYLPAANSGNGFGSSASSFTTSIQIETSVDNSVWSAPVTFTLPPVALRKYLTLPATVSARYIRLTFLAGGLPHTLDEFRIHNGPTTLPVTFSQLSAKLSGSNVLVNWTTASEQNNDHFEIEASTDGKTFKTLKKVASKNGNSSTVQEYQESVSISDIAALLAIPALLGFVGFSPLSRRRKLVTLALAGVVAASTFAACQKEGEDMLAGQNGTSANIHSGEKPVYIRIKQVDKDGKFTYSNTIVASK